MRIIRSYVKYPLFFSVFVYFAAGSYSHILCIWNFLCRDRENHFFWFPGESYVMPRNRARRLLIVWNVQVYFSWHNDKDMFHSTLAHATTRGRHYIFLSVLGDMLCCVVLQLSCKYTMAWSLQVSLWQLNHHFAAPSSSRATGSPGEHLIMRKI